MSKQIFFNNEKNQFSNKNEKKQKLLGKELENNNNRGNFKKRIELLGLFWCIKFV